MSIHRVGVSGNVLVAYKESEIPKLYQDNGNYSQAPSEYQFDDGYNWYRTGPWDVKEPWKYLSVNATENDPKWPDENFKKAFADFFMRSEKRNRLRELATQYSRVVKPPVFTETVKSFLANYGLADPFFVRLSGNDFIRFPNAEHSLMMDDYLMFPVNAHPGIMVAKRQIALFEAGLDPAKKLPYLIDVPASVNH